MDLFRVPLVAVLVLACTSHAQTLGSIRITVLDERQSPVNGAWVTAHHAGVFEASWPGFCTTGADGSCTMRIQGPGRFALEASKTADKYPPKFSFYFGKNFKEDIVELADADSGASVVLRVGPKAGAIKPKVVDAVSGKEIFGSYEFHWGSDHDIWMETGTAEIGDPVLVPANVPVTLVVSHPGYEDWKYSRPDGNLKTILLRAGEEMHLKIRLRPKR